MRRCVAIALTLAVAGCGSPFGPGIQVAGSPTDVTLHVGQVALLDGVFRVGVQGVPSDSRCPMNADCVWVGDAAVAIVTSSGTGPSYADTVHTALDPKGVARWGYSITLVELTPYPVAPGTIRQDQYAVRLHVAPVVPLFAASGASSTR